MDGDLLNKDFLYGCNFLDDLTNECWSSLLDVAEASPSEILADAAPVLVPPISPHLTASPKTSSNETSSSDSGSEDDSSKLSSVNSQDRQSSLSPFDWLNHFDEPRRNLNLVDVEGFLQKNNTDEHSLQPEPNTENRPFVSIENGVIKVQGMKIEQVDSDVIQDNLNFLYMNNLNNGLANGNLQNHYLNGVNKKDFPENNSNIQKSKPNILKKCQNVTNIPQIVVPTTPPTVDSGKITITPLMIKHNAQKLRKISVSPPKNIVIPNNNVCVNNVSNTMVQTTMMPNVEMIPTSSELDLSHLSEAEIRAFKKQQRMIKNRESACQSRQKKKDYMSALENQLMEAHQEIGRLRLENQLLRDQLDATCPRTRKMPRMDATMIIPKKNIAVLFAMVFMVSLNFNVLGWNSRPLVTPPETHHNARHLLWNEDTSNEILDYDQVSNSSLTNCSNSTNIKSDYTYINQTESIRIAGELNRWIRRGKTLNWTYDAPRRKRKTYFNYDDKIHGGIFDPTYKLFEKLNLNPTLMPFNPGTKHGRPMRDRSRFRKFRRGRMSEYDDSMVDYEMMPRHEGLGEWGAVVRALQRRDDTFYVVSVGSGEHLLLPAVAHNDTHPPKMALILPAKTGNDSAQNELVTLMQIDCSVLNTTLVQLKSEMLPESLRKNGEKIAQIPRKAHGPQLPPESQIVSSSPQDPIKNVSRHEEAKPRRNVGPAQIFSAFGYNKP